jgi:hypothetical protein
VGAGLHAHQEEEGEGADPRPCLAGEGEEGEPPFRVGEEGEEEGRRSPLEVVEEVEAEEPPCPAGEGVEEVGVLPYREEEGEVEGVVEEAQQLTTSCLHFRTTVFSARRLPT